MHELGIAENVVDAVLARMGDARVARVFLEVGRLTCVEPDAIRFCFELCARGTTVEGATLEIDEVPGRARCGACGADPVEVDGPFLLCACGSAALEVLAGDRLRVTAVETA